MKNKMPNLRYRSAVLIACFFFAVLAMAEAQTLHSRAKNLPCLNKQFNLHIHVGVDSFRNTNFSQASMEAAIASANRFFAPICVSFALCDWEVIENYNFDSVATTMEEQEIRTLFHVQNRINVYVFEELREPTLCGFAAGGGSPYVFLKKGCPGSLTHELGHVFGLPHTFAGNGTENVDGSNCDTAGDGICDTPADPYDPDDEDTVWQDGCEFVYEGLDANGQFYQPNMGNIMSYYGCDCGFTRGQYLRMVEAYNNGLSKIW